MWVHRRLAALALFGVQLLQGTLPAAGGVCADAAPATAHEAGAVTVVVAPPHHGHAGAPQDAAAHAAMNASDTPAPADSSSPAHPHESTTCPMAMACAVAGLMSTAVAVELHEVLVTTDRSERIADRLVSVDVTPEPPPPRR